MPSKKIDDILDELLKDVSVSEPVDVNLPSKGIGYKLKDENKSISVRPSNFEDELEISKSMESGSNYINLLLARCVPNVRVKDIYIFDKSFLVLKIKELTYGHEHKVSVTCPECDKPSALTYDLKDLPVTKVPDDFEDPVELVLPKSGKTCRVTLPRIRHEEYLISPESTLNNLWRFLADFEGNDNKELLSKVLKRLPMPDIQAILGTLVTKYGIESEITFVCANCRFSSVMELPVSSDFFMEN